MARVTSASSRSVDEAIARLRALGDTRNVEGMRAESRQKIFDQVRETLDQAVAKTPDDAQLLGMQASMFKEFASTHEAEGDRAAAARSCRPDIA